MAISIDLAHICSVFPNLVSFFYSRWVVFYFPVRKCHSKLFITKIWFSFQITKNIISVTCAHVIVNIWSSCTPQDFELNLCPKLASSPSHSRGRKFNCFQIGRANNKLGPREHRVACVVFDGVGYAPLESEQLSAHRHHSRWRPHYAAKQGWSGKAVYRTGVLKLIINANNDLSFFLSFFLSFWAMPVFAANHI